MYTSADVQTIQYRRLNSWTNHIVRTHTEIFLTNERYIVVIYLLDVVVDMSAVIECTHCAITVQIVEDIF